MSAGADTVGGMRLLHTSDWHIGRTFHGHSTLEALRGVLGALVGVVRERAVDVVLVAGDVFDSATPSGEAFALLTEALRGIRAAGASVVLTSGNHDAPARLGFQSEFAAFGGVHVLARPEALAQPVVFGGGADAGDAGAVNIGTVNIGAINIYGIPYLAPALVQHLWPETVLRTQREAMAHAMELVRADAAARGGRSVVLAHTFAAGGASESAESERDISAGGVDVVPLSTFDGVDYTALGHIHGRATLAPTVRYSGAPLHYSFSEAGKARGAWLVELNGEAPASVEWVDLPIPRPLAVLTGTLGELLTDAALARHESSWVRAVLTDQSRPLDAMRALQTRFPRCAELVFRPAVTVEDGAGSYTERVVGKRDPELIAGFLEHVRNGEGPSADEAALIEAFVAADENQRLRA